MNEQFSADELADIHASMALHEAMIVKGEIVGDKVYMESPYNPDLVDRIRKAKMGQWSGAKKRWVFPVSRLDKVKELYKEVYGEDGFSEAVKAVAEIDIDTARAAGMPIESKSKAIWFMGKQLARTFSKDKKPRVDKDVTVVSGGFTSGGSENIPEVEAQPGTVVIVNDLPMDALVPLLTAKGDSAGVKVITTSAPNGMPVSAPQASATGTTNKTSGGGVTSSGGTSGSAAGSAPQATAKTGPITFDELTDVSAKTKYIQTELMIKALATRMAQLPADAVDPMLANYGLKRKQ